MVSYGYDVHEVQVYDVLELATEDYTGTQGKIRDTFVSMSASTYSTS